MKISVLILAAAVVSAPSLASAAEVKGPPPEQWLQCFAATKLHQEALAAHNLSMNVILQAGEPRLRYQRLAKAYLAKVKKMDSEAANGEMVRAPAEMKKTKTLAETEELARSCIENLPNLADPAFYDKYEFLRDQMDAN